MIFVRIVKSCEKAILFDKVVKLICLSLRPYVTIKPIKMIQLLEEIVKTWSKIDIVMFCRVSISLMSLRFNNLVDMFVWNVDHSWKNIGCRRDVDMRSITEIGRLKTLPMQVFYNVWKIACFWMSLQISLSCCTFFEFDRVGFLDICNLRTVFLFLL